MILKVVRNITFLLSCLIFLYFLEVIKTGYDNLTTFHLWRGMRCSSCMADFEDAGDYRSHCRAEWHNFNLKRTLGPQAAARDWKMNIWMVEDILHHPKCLISIK